MGYEVMQAILNCVWCYAITAVVCIAVTAVLVGVERAILDLTGLNLEEAIGASCRFVGTLPARAQEAWDWVYVWGICNPTWAWNLLDSLEEKFTGKKPGSPDYFKF